MADVLLMSPALTTTTDSISSAALSSEWVDAPKFSVPEHPSVKYWKSLKSTSDLPDDGPQLTRRDPHEVPTYTDETFLQPACPVLYLPPLISSLPNTLPPLPIPTEHPPMVTETRLPDIDPVSLSLHKALHYFRPLDDKYASLPYAEAFNWSQLRLPLHEEREWYCVAFRSKRKEGSDGTRQLLDHYTDR